MGTPVAIDTPITGPATVCTSHAPEANKIVLFHSLKKQKGPNKLLSSSSGIFVFISHTKCNDIQIYI